MVRAKTDSAWGRAVAMGTAVVLLGSGLAEAAETTDPALAAALADLTVRLDSERVKRNLPSLSVAVVRGNDIVLRRAFGYADLGRKTPATPEHLYRAGSITKVFVATALVQLVEKGTLRLDDPLAKYVPEYLVRSPFPDTPPTTLRQLASHTSGLPRDAPVNFWMNYSIGAWPFSRGRAPIRWYVSKERLLETLPSVELERLPDTEPLYSNLGMSLLAFAIERASGEAFPDYVAQHILRPLGTVDSGLVLDGVRARFDPSEVDLARYAGAYALPGGFAHVDVTVRDGTLWLAVREADSPATRCEPTGPHRFSCGLEFRVEGDGRVRGLSFARFDFP